MDKHYTLRHRTGIFTAAGKRVTVIGQTAGCDLQIPNHSPYEDVVFAKIVPDRDKRGWHIVRVTPFHPIRINGLEMNRVHYLSDGDNIDFGNMSCRFNITDGANAVPNITYTRGNGKAVATLAAAVALIATVIGWRIYDNQSERLTEAMITDIESSLFTTCVDSLQLVCGDSVADSYTYVSAPVGTAFLTDDSILVTARHCIQPWLNQILPQDYSRLATVTEWPVAAALRAETRNQLDGTEAWRVRSYITITDEDGNSRSVNSDDFTMNTASDEIVELGGYDDPGYWRSISHRYSRCDMMLGDIAAMNYGKAGNIAVADNKHLHELLHRGTRLYFFGHPASSVNGNRLEYKTDELRLPLDTLPGEKDRLFLLSHGGELTPGFSGGPVIVRDGISYRAVGIVSVIDGQNNTRSYSVPTSELFNPNIK